MAWSPDGKQVASGSRDETVEIWQTSTGKELSGHAVCCVCFSPCGTKIVSGGGVGEEHGGNGDFSIRIWDAGTGTQIGSPLSGHSRYFECCFLLLLVFKRVMCADY